MYEYISDAAKGVILEEIYLFDCGVYLSSDICRMRWADLSANRSQRVNLAIRLYSCWLEYEIYLQDITFTNV